MTLEKHIELMDVGTLSYEDLKKLQHKLNQDRADGKINDRLICAQVYPVIDFGHNPNRNRFSSSGLAYIKNNFGKQIDKIDEETVAKLNELNKGNITFSYSNRGGGATVIMPGQYLYFPVIDLANLNINHVEIGKMTDKIIEAMRQVSHHLISDSSKVKLASLGPSASTGQESFDVAYDIDGKLHKLGSKGIAHVRYAASNGQKVTLLKGGFLFHNERGSIDNFHLVDPCGIPIEVVGVTTFEDVTGKKIDRDYFNSLVHEAVKEHFYNPIPKRN